jgi:hypothetical protein
MNRMDSKKFIFYQIIETITYANGLILEKEFLFHTTRKWRLDLALQSFKIGFEYEGVFGTGLSRHTTKIGFSNDCEKYNNAALLGWRIFRFTAKDFSNKQVAKTSAFIKEIIKGIL